MYIEGNAYDDEGWEALRDSEFLQDLEYPVFEREEEEAEEEEEEEEEFEDIEEEEEEEEEEIIEDDEYTQ